MLEKRQKSDNGKPTKIDFPVFLSLTFKTERRGLKIFVTRRQHDKTTTTTMTMTGWGLISGRIGAFGLKD